jgi:hypothetical protein
VAEVFLAAFLSPDKQMARRFPGGRSAPEEIFGIDDLTSSWM